MALPPSDGLPAALPRREVNSSAGCHADGKSWRVEGRGASKSTARQASVDMLSAISRAWRVSDVNCTK